MNNVYIVGKGKPPEWCRRFIMPYVKNDGTTGYEFHGKFIAIAMTDGDKLIYKDGKIGFERGKTR